MVRKHERYGKLTNMLSNTGNTNVMKNIVLDDERSDVDLRFSAIAIYYVGKDETKIWNERAPN